MTLDPESHDAAARAADCLALNNGLRDLARFDQRRARILELRYFGGLKQNEIAEVTGVHVNTVARELRLAEAWLRNQMH